MISLRLVIACLLCYFLVFVQCQAYEQNQYAQQAMHAGIPPCPPGEVNCAHTQTIHTTITKGTTTSTTTSTSTKTVEKLATVWITKTTTTTMLGWDCTVTSTSTSTKPAFTTTSTELEVLTVFTSRTVTSTHMVTSTVFQMCSPRPETKPKPVDNPGKTDPGKADPGKADPQCQRVLGFNYELFHNTFPRASLSDAYDNFDPTKYNAGGYITKGVALKLAFENAVPAATTMYGTSVTLSEVVANNFFYLYSDVTQTVTFRSVTSDIGLLWIGDLAISGYTAANAVGKSVGGVPFTPGQQFMVYSINVQANSYTPIRYIFATDKGTREVAALVQFNGLGNVHIQPLAYAHVCPGDAKPFPQY